MKYNQKTKAATAAGDVTEAIQTLGKTTFKVIDPNADFQGTLIIWRRIGAAAISGVDTSGVAEPVGSYTEADLPLYKVIDDAAVNCYFWLEADVWTAGTGISMEVVTSDKGN